MAEEAIEHAGDRLAAWVLEPRVQGAAGMVMHPHGYAKRTATAARKVGATIFFDEVLTAFEQPTVNVGDVNGLATELLSLLKFRTTPSRSKAIDEFSYSAVAKSMIHIYKSD
jgi:adenosylmethionine-8-amino-7-oxononanoate aminotransferase